MAKNRKMVLICFLVMLMIFGGTAVASSMVSQKSQENLDDGSDYSAYYDNSETKEKDKCIQIEGKNINVSYVRTENLKEKPVSQRKNDYGTYDVFVDDEETEYLYLINTELFCGYKKSVVGTPLPQDEAISIEKATQFCEKYIKENRDYRRDYRLTGCYYDERGGYYDCEYSLYLNDVKTDDVLRIWVASEGCITAVSEFNRNCYDGCEINTQQCNEAKAVAIDNLNKKLDAKVSYSEIDGYLSKNDDGELVYVIVVKIMIPAGNESSVVQIERIDQTIK